MTTAAITAPTRKRKPTMPPTMPPIRASSVFDVGVCAGATVSVVVEDSVDDEPDPIDPVDAIDSIDPVDPIDSVGPVDDVIVIADVVIHGSQVQPVEIVSQSRQLVSLKPWNAHLRIDLELFREGIPPVSMFPDTLLPSDASEMGQK